VNSRSVEDEYTLIAGFCLSEKRIEREGDCCFERLCQREANLNLTLQNNAFLFQEFLHFDLKFSKLE